INRNPFCRRPQKHHLMLNRAQDTLPPLLRYVGGRTAKMFLGSHDSSTPVPSPRRPFPRCPTQLLAKPAVAGVVSVDLVPGLAHGEAGNFHRRFEDLERL